MSRDLAREIGREQAAGGRHRRLVREVRRANRERRRAEREVTGRWWRRRGVPVGDRRSLASAPAPRAEDVTRELAVLLTGIAERIAEHGTATERFALTAVHDTARWTSPGAAEALLDWDGPETARLRAFGILHGQIMGVLGPEDRAWLLERLRGGQTIQYDDWVA